MSGGCRFAPRQVASDDDIDAGQTDATDAAIDALPPVQCGALQCDPHAMCVDGTGGANATCACTTGFSGDGMTCTDVDECASANGGCQAACQNTMGSHVCYAPQTCADLVAHAVASAGTSQMLYLDADPSKPWTVFCSPTNTEYIAVNANNVSKYEHGGASPGTDVVTTFSKVRFVVATKKIDISDRDYAVDNGGMVNHSGNGTMVTSMPLGIAMNCKATNDKSTRATVDLTGSHFAMTGAAAFAGAGSSHNQATAMSNNNQKAVIDGGGFCGWNAPVNTPNNPFNDNVDATNGQLLALVYF